MSLFFNTLQDFERKHEGIDETLLEAKIVSEALVSKGTPPDWNLNNLIKPGLIKENKIIDEKKIRLFYSISKTDYELLRSSFGIHSDFAIYLIDSEDNPIEINGKYVASLPQVNFKSQTINISHQDIENLARIQRAVLYRGEPARMVVLTWR